MQENVKITQVEVTWYNDEEHMQEGIGEENIHFLEE